MSKPPKDDRDVRVSTSPARETKQSAGASERGAEDHLIRGYN